MDNDAVPPISDSDPRFRSAAQWMLRIRQDDVESTTLCDFADWLESSAENRQAFARCEVVSELIQMAVSGMARNGARRHG